jgi:hypothetical protein
MSFSEAERQRAYKQLGYEIEDLMVTQTQIQKRLVDLEINLKLKRDAQRSLQNLASANIFNARCSPGCDR